MVLKGPVHSKSVCVCVLPLTELMFLWLVLARSISGVSEIWAKEPFILSASSLYFFYKTNTHVYCRTLLATHLISVPPFLSSSLSPSLQYLTVYILQVGSVEELWSVCHCSKRALSQLGRLLIGCLQDTHTHTQSCEDLYL